MNYREFCKYGWEIAKQVKSDHKIQYEYFKICKMRLFDTCTHFNLFNKVLGDVLEIGPFYSYTPFILKKNSKSYTVIEGDDPITFPLLELYKKYNIEFSSCDLFDIFGPYKESTYILPFKKDQFDTIICWETIEHFNFNPVKFIRELHRILKPGGFLYITVPNKFSFLNLLQFILGWKENKTAEDFLKYENYQNKNKKSFYGFHWHEYGMRELLYLIKQIGFNIVFKGSLTSFPDNYYRLSVYKKLLRNIIAFLGKCFPRFSFNVTLVASK